jgi:hypothetical protein
MEVSRNPYMPVTNNMALSTNPGYTGALYNGGGVTNNGYLNPAISRQTYEIGQEELRLTNRNQNRQVLEQRENIFNQQPTNNYEENPGSKGNPLSLVGNFGKGVVASATNMVKGLLFDTNGHIYLGNIFKGLAFAAACCIPVVGPAIAIGAAAFTGVPALLKTGESVINMASMASQGRWQEADEAAFSAGYNGFDAALSLGPIKGLKNKLVADVKAFTGASNAKALLGQSMTPIDLKQVLDAKTQAASSTISPLQTALNTAESNLQAAQNPANQAALANAKAALAKAEAEAGITTAAADLKLAENLARNSTKQTTSLWDGYKQTFDLTTDAQRLTFASARKALEARSEAALKHAGNTTARPTWWNGVVELGKDASEILKGGSPKQATLQTNVLNPFKAHMVQSISPLNPSAVFGWRNTLITDKLTAEQHMDPNTQINREKIARQIVSNQMSQGGVTGLGGPGFLLSNGTIGMGPEGRVNFNPFGAGMRP